MKKNSKKITKNSTNKKMKRKRRLYFISLQKPKRYFLGQSIQKNKEKAFTTKPSIPFKIIKILYDNSIELVLLIIGFLFLIRPTVYNIKISLTLILIATFLIFLMTGEYETTPYPQKQYSILPIDDKRKFQGNSVIKKIQIIPQQIRSIPLSNRISVVLILWTLFLFVLIKDIEVYFVLILLGMLITREITDIHTSNIYKKRLDAYLFIFVLIFIVIISQKIIGYM